jgi:hypothetical protein
MDSPQAGNEVGAPLNVGIYPRNLLASIVASSAF